MKNLRTGLESAMNSSVGLKYSLQVEIPTLRRLDCQQITYHIHFNILDMTVYISHKL